MTQVLGENQKEWIRELRSGKYPQDIRYLKTNRGFCCLGVGCEVMGKIPRLVGDEENQWWEYPYRAVTSAPTYLKEHLALRDYSGAFDFSTEPGLEENVGNKTALTACNDGGWTFQQIADFCEKYPHVVFKEPR